jgi:hypothetical protein
VTFPQRRAGDLSFLADRLSRVALQPHELRLDCDDGGDGCSPPTSPPSYQVLAARWFEYFDAEYAGDSAGGQKTAAVQQSDSRSADCEAASAADDPQLQSLIAVLCCVVCLRLWWWTLRALDARQVRLVLAGLQRASGCGSGESSVILTSSLRLRDELIVAALPTSSCSNEQGRSRDTAGHRQTMVATARLGRLLLTRLPFAPSSLVLSVGACATARLTAATVRPLLPARRAWTAARAW